MRNILDRLPLGDIAAVSAGNSAPQEDALFANGTHPFFRTSDVGRIRFGTLDIAVDCLNERGVAGMRRFPKGTILFPKSGASTFLNHRVQMGVDGYVASHLATITANPDRVNGRYLLYFLATVKAQSLVQDQNYPSLNLPAIKSILVPAPTLAEQRRIVAILDEAFEGIAAAKANAERNLRNVRDVFEAALNTSLDAASAQGRTGRLGDLVTRLTNGYVGPTRNIYTETGVPYLLARHVKDNNLQFDEKTYVSDAFNKRNSKSILRKGDVLLVQSGHIGHSAVVPQEHEGHNCHAMIVISTKPGTVTGEFLSLFFNSNRMRQAFWAIRSGSTVPHLTCKAVKELEIPMPPLESQASLVSRASSMRNDCDLLCDAAARKLTALDELKASLLHQAFTGQL